MARVERIASGDEERPLRVTKFLASFASLLRACARRGPSRCGVGRSMRQPEFQYVVAENRECRRFVWLGRGFSVYTMVRSMIKRMARPGVFAQIRSHD